MRHNSLIGLVLTLWLGCAAVSAVAPGPPQNSTLEATLALVEQQYCAPSPALTSLQLKLRLRYKNVGQQKLILYRGHDLFYQTRIRSLPFDRTIKPYEIVFANARYFDAEFEPIELPSPGKVFVILPPGGVYERDVQVGLGVTNGEAATGNHLVREGRHTLELIVSTWYQSRPLAEKLRQRWARKGLLLFDPIVSLPLELTVDKPAHPAPCV